MCSKGHLFTRAILFIIILICTTNFKRKYEIHCLLSLFVTAFQRIYLLKDIFRIYSATKINSFKLGIAGIKYLFSESRISTTWILNTGANSFMLSRWANESGKIWILFRCRTMRNHGPNAFLWQLVIAINCLLFKGSLIPTLESQTQWSNYAYSRKIPDKNISMTFIRCSTFVDCFVFINFLFWFLSLHSVIDYTMLAKSTEAREVSSGGSWETANTAGHRRFGRWIQNGAAGTIVFGENPFQTRTRFYRNILQFMGERTE